jgi:CBS domain-containing protein
MKKEVVRDIMTRHVVSIAEASTALEAAKLMTEKAISSLIVTKDDYPIGILTENDFVKKICIKEMQPSNVKVGDIMSKIRTYADPETPVEVAVQRMINHKIHRLPVMVGGNVIGIITVTDLAEHLRTILFTEQLLITGLKIRSSLHILRTLFSATLLDFAVIIIFRFLVDLTDLIFEYPPLTTKSRSIVSPSGSLTYGLFSIVTKTRKSDRLDFVMMGP